MGWLHRVCDDPRRRPLAPQASEQDESGRLAAIADYDRNFRSCVTDALLSSEAGRLGVQCVTLLALGVGWSALNEAYSWPMFDHARRIVGIRLRSSSGEKWAVRGSYNGLFMPKPLDHGGPVLLPEGPTDTATLYDLGFDTIGRPSDRAGAMEMRRWFLKHKRDAVIVGENDGAGRSGVAKYLEELRGATRVKFIFPIRGKDVRQWRCEHGATRDDILDIIDCAGVH